MNESKRNLITSLHNAGFGYDTIANRLRLSRETVRYYCKKEKTENQDSGKCLYCNSPLINTKGKKNKKFCNDKCRSKWWAKHAYMLNRKQQALTIICPTCKKSFDSYGNRNRKYCSHECYIKARFYGDSV